MTGLQRSFDAATRAGTTNELMLAVSYGPVETVRKLLLEGADIHYRNALDCTPLMWAVYKKRPEIARLLIEYRADVNSKSMRGTTALMFAARHGDANTALLLINSGANIHEKDNEGSTAFDYARNKGQKKILEMLEAALSAEKERAGHLIALGNQGRLNKMAKKIRVKLS